MWTDSFGLQGELDSEELRHRLLGLSRLLSVTHRIAAAVDLNEILQLITDEACLALECDRASLYQFDGESRELYTRVVTELEIAEIRSPISRGISGYVARTGEVANVPDPHVDPRWNSTVDLQTGYHTRNILAAPVESPHEKRLLGVLELINKREGVFDDFDVELLLAFTQHAAVALDRARVVEELQRRRQVEASLNVARDVQRSFMPSSLPVVAKYELATWWFPQEAVGGDYCDVITLNDGCLGLVIADVSGHGLGPSLLMASVRAALRALVLQHTEPATIMRLLAHALSGDLQDGRFITMVLAALDTHSHTIRYANAGHGPALHYSQRTASFRSLESNGLPLGVDDDPVFDLPTSVMLEPGDLVLLCTDGIVEAMNDIDQPFSQTRLENLVREVAYAPAEQIATVIGDAVSAHYEGESPPDDLTILVAKRLEDSSPAGQPLA